MLVPQDSFTPSEPVLFNVFSERRTRAQSRDLIRWRLIVIARPFVRFVRPFMFWR
jgi:hypothetical protein